VRRGIPFLFLGYNCQTCTVKGGLNLTLLRKGKQGESGPRPEGE